MIEDDFWKEIRMQMVAAQKSSYQYDAEMMKDLLGNYDLPAIVAKTITEIKKEIPTLVSRDFEFEIDIPNSKISISIKGSNANKSGKKEDREDSWEDRSEINRLKRVIKHSKETIDELNEKNRNNEKALESIIKEMKEKTDNLKKSIAKEMKEKADKLKEKTGTDVRCDETLIVDKMLEMVQSIEEIVEFLTNPTNVKLMKSMTYVKIFDSCIARIKNSKPLGVEKTKAETNMLKSAQKIRGLLKLMDDGKWEEIMKLNEELMAKELKERKDKANEEGKNV